MNECPFCGKVENPVSSNPTDHCHFVGEYADKLTGIRSPYCYERQLAQQTDLLRRAKKIIEIWGSHEGIYYYEVLKTTHEQAQALLPELEKALEGNDG